jgi:hypothetical protein
MGGIRELLLDLHARQGNCLSWRNEIMSDGRGWKYEAYNINIGLEMASMGYDRPAMEQKTLPALDLLLKISPILPLNTKEELQQSLSEADSSRLRSIQIFPKYINAVTGIHYHYTSVFPS